MGLADVLATYVNEARLPPKVSGTSASDREFLFYGARQQIDKKANRIRGASLIAAFNSFFLLAMLYALPLAAGSLAPLIDVYYSIPLIVGVAALSFFVVYCCFTSSDPMDFNSDVGFRGLSEIVNFEFLGPTAANIYSERAHDVIAGRVSVSSTEVHGLVRIPLRNVERVQIAVATVTIRKHANMRRLARFLGTDAVTLSFKSPIEAQQFCDCIRQRLNRSLQ